MQFLDVEKQNILKVFKVVVYKPELLADSFQIFQVNVVKQCTPNAINSSIDVYYFNKFVCFWYKSIHTSQVKMFETQQNI